jgi:hypothetical protein
VRTLVAELGVNLAGVEVILHMRERMLDQRREVERILETVACELRRELLRGGLPVRPLARYRPQLPPPPG